MTPSYIIIMPKNWLVSFLVIGKPFYYFTITKRSESEIVHGDDNILQHLGDEQQTRDFVWGTGDVGCGATVQVPKRRSREQYTCLTPRVGATFEVDRDSNVGARVIHRANKALAFRVCE